MLLRAKGVVCLLTLCVLPSHWAYAQRLPVRNYSTADGLAGDDVRAILQDSRGFLWVGTTTGLSRFDGQEFRSYGTADGLPHTTVNDLLQERNGTLWVATAAGLARLEQAALSFEAVALDGRTDMPVHRLHQDRAGRLWAGGGRHLVEIVPRGEHFETHRIEVPLATAPPPGAGSEIESIAEDATGRIWIGTTWGLAALLPDDRTIARSIRPTETDDSVRHLAIDGKGRLWLTHWGFTHRPGLPWGVYVWNAGADPADAAPGSYVSGDGPYGEARVHGAFPARDGAVWLATENGIVRVDASRVQRFGAEAGLGVPVRVIMEDRSGNLWLGTRGSGLSRVATQGFTTYTVETGLSAREVSALVEDRTNRLCVTGFAANGARRFGALDGHRFVPFTPGGTGGIEYWGWGWNHVLLQARGGEWWLATGEGLIRYPATDSCTTLARLRPSFVYTRADGLASDNVFRIFEDSRGDVWIAAFGQGALARWVRARGTIERFDAIGTRAPTAFEEDRDGNIWMGLYASGLARYRRGSLQFFDGAHGLPAGLVEDLHLDRRGRLWIGLNPGGLARLDDPGAEHPVVSRPIAAEGLSEHAVLSIVEDRWGRIYAATARGILRFDPDANTMRRFSTADGLASNIVRASYADRTGTIWFGTMDGLSRLTPQPEPASMAPPVFIEAVRIGGVPLSLPQQGAAEIRDIRIEPEERRIEIAYGSVSLEPGEILRYQTMLEGIDTRWSEPASGRSTLYANLPPGEYRFLVRTSNADGLASAEPGVVAFSVIPPVWQRAWFLALVGALGAVTVALVHRIRVNRLLALERVRTRLATDLHDDLGARLSRISILSEVAKRQLAADPADAARLFEDVGETARGLIQASADIAWSIDPRHDDLGSLVARIRRFASDMLDACGVAWTFDAPHAKGQHLPPEHRRHVLLVFQEAINNVARHSGARRVALALHVAGRQLEAIISDDGRGFDPERNGVAAGADDGRGGRGLVNMAARARALRGELRVASAPGQGTRINLRVPLP